MTPDDIAALSDDELEIRLRAAAADDIPPALIRRLVEHRDDLATAAAAILDLLSKR